MIVTRRFKFDDQFLKLIKGSAKAIIFRVASVLLAFLMNLLVAIHYGAHLSGFFFLAFTLVAVISSLSRLGLENTIVKYLSIGLKNRDHDDVWGAFVVSLLATSVIAIVAFFLISINSSFIAIVIFSKPELAEPLRLISISIVPLTISVMLSYALQGIHKVGSSIFLFSIIIPMFVCCYIYYLADHSLVGLINAYSFSAIIACVIGGILWRVYAPKFTLSYKVGFFQEVFKTSMPIYIGVVMNMIILWGPILIVGIFDTAENVAIYNVCTRLASLTTFFLLAVRSVAAPRFAEIYSNGIHEDTEKFVRRIAVLVLISTLPVFFVIVFFRSFLLQLFGTDFLNPTSSFVLLILVIANFSTILNGGAGYMLMMSGNEKRMRNNLLVCAGLCLVLCFLLIPLYGIIGASFAVLSVLVYATYNETRLVQKYLGIYIYRKGRSSGS